MTENSNSLLTGWKMTGERLAWVTLLLILASVGATVMAYFYAEPTYRLLYATGLEIWLKWKWWGLVTSVFIHGGILHLFYNCYWTWIFGQLLERRLGPVRYLGLFLVAAWVGSVAELAWSGQEGVGLSGVVYAYFGFLLVNRSRNEEYARILSGQTVPILIGWLVLCFPLTYAKIMNVANFAHLGGLVTGCVLGIAADQHRWQSRARHAMVYLLLLSFVPLIRAPWHENWHVARASRAMQRRDYDAALVSLEIIRGKHPDYAWALLNEVAIREQRGQYAIARDILTVAADKSSDATILNNLAWLLATCPAEGIRDGAKAISLGRRACEAEKWSNASYLDTLAAAYAEAGDFIEAVKWATQALKIPGVHARIVQKHLDAFRASKPWREPAIAR